MNRICRSTNMRVIGSFAVIGMAAIIGCSGCSNCANHVVADATSPTSNLRAVIFGRDCGATTGFSTQVSLIDLHAGTPAGKGNIFVADDNHGTVSLDANRTIPLKTSWTSDHHLIISYPGNARVFLKRSEYRGVRIAYEVLPVP